MVPWSLRPDLRRSRGATKSARRYLRFGGKLKHGDPCRCCPGFSALRGRRTSWYSNEPYKLVGMTGVAPARARAHEFLRLACLLVSTTRRRKNWSRRPDLHRHGPYAQRGLSPLCLLFHHDRAMEPARGRAPRCFPYQGSASLSMLCRRKTGGTGRNRTDDLRLMRALRCCCATEPKWWGMRIGCPRPTG